MNLMFLFPFLEIGTAWGATYTVSSPDGVNGKTYNAGDVIIIKNGTYTDKEIILKSNGSFVKPIILKAETDGQVILNGNSSISISGTYIEVQGLRFKDGYSNSGKSIINFRTSSSDVATYCKVSECSIENYNNSDNTVDYKWVSIYGKNNTIENCYFVNKTHIGTLLVVWLISGDTQGVNHTISNNYFGYRNSILDNKGNELNGQEIIRIGDSNTSLQPANCIVENNYFERTNGEIEIISNKSCGNIYRNNMFYECVGTLTLRHGNGCTVDGNWFLGNNIANTGGVRIIGENHVVMNNYMYKLGGSGYRSAICAVLGEVNNALNGYAQVKNSKVFFNTIYQCNSGMEIGYGSGDSQTLPPIGSQISNNIATQLSGKINLKVTTIASTDITWKNNILNGGTVINKPSSGTTTSFVINYDTYSNENYSFSIPQSGALTSKITTSTYAEVMTDIWGAARATNSRTPGAMEPNVIPIRTIPSVLSTGPQWMKNTTATPTVRNHINKDFFISNKLLTIGENSNSIRIVTPAGQQIAILNSLESNNRESKFNLSSLRQGIYIGHTDKSTISFIIN